MRVVKKKWDMIGIPCFHAIACIYFQHRHAEEFVADCYKREVYLKAYAGSIPPCSAERHWPRSEGELDPLPIKIGPGRPRKNRIKDPFEDPNKPRVLTETGVEMHCSVCRSKDHNKRRCPNAATAPTEPPTKKLRGRSRKDGQPPQPQSTVGESSHHAATAQPAQLGRGGRAIRGGIGSRGGGKGRGRENGRGSGASTSSQPTDNTAATGRGRGRRRGRGRGRGRTQVPVGVEVFIAVDGEAYTNHPFSTSNEPRVVTQSSQASTITRQTQ